MSQFHRREGQVDWGDALGAGTLLGLGWVLVTLTTAHALAMAGSGFGVVAAAVVPVTLSVLFFVAGSAIWHLDLYDRTRRIAGWTVVGTIGAVVPVSTATVGAGFLPLPFVRSLGVVVESAAVGSVLGLLVGLYDANRTRLETTTEAERRRAEHLSRRLEVLNRVLRHDVRHQAQVIRGQAELLREGEQETVAGATHILAANDRLVEVADQARELQRLLRGEDHAPRTVDLGTTLEAAIETATAEHPRLRVENRVRGEHRVVASPLLEDAMVHVLENAVVHEEAGDPRVEIDVASDASDRTRLTIADEGPGMPADEPFLSDRPTESRLEHSSGFGLWFVTWVVEAAGGTVDVRSPDGDDVGTVVSFAFREPGTGDVGDPSLEARDC
ncbi:MAG: sensor histidine kinase [Halanaeroarchaeum sp.]